VEPDPIGPMLRRLRLGADLTLERLSELSGISDRALSDIERGVARGPQHRTVVAIARALGLSGPDHAAMVEAARAGRRYPRPGPPSLPPLPRDVPDFTGRGEELARVTAALTGPWPPFVVVTGPPGYGKTSLAVRAAHLLRNAFTDQLFVELGGTTPGPPPADVVATRALRALTGQEGPPGAAPEQLRRVLADRSLLLVLDDAATESQIRAVLPAARRTAVLVTSRRSLAGLDAAERIRVDRLPAEDAQRLLAAIIPADQAAGADLGRLARLCDGVPLALRIAGNRLACRPGWTVAGLTARLAVPDHRLDGLTAGDLQMRAAIERSFAQLEPAAQQLFRRLALIDGRTFGADLAGALLRTGAVVRRNCSTSSPTCTSSNPPPRTATPCPSSIACTQPPSWPPRSHPLPGMPCARDGTSGCSPPRRVRLVSCCPASGWRRAPGEMSTPSGGRPPMPAPGSPTRPRTGAPRSSAVRGRAIVRTPTSQTSLRACRRAAPPSGPGQAPPMSEPVLVPVTATDRPHRRPPRGTTRGRAAGDRDVWSPRRGVRVADTSTSTPDRQTCSRLVV
jgi:hypothetical protein